VPVDPVSSDPIDSDMEPCRKAGWRTIEYLTIVMIPKHKNIRDRSYILWLRNQPSLIPYGTGDIVPHHIKMFGGGGIALKPPDDHCIPIYQSIHDDIGQNGERSILCRKYGYTYDMLWSACMEYRRRYLAQTS